MCIRLVRRCGIVAFLNEACLNDLESTSLSCESSGKTMFWNLQLEKAFAFICVTLLGIIID